MGVCEGLGDVWKEREPIKTTTIGVIPNKIMSWQSTEGASHGGSTFPDTLRF